MNGLENKPASEEAPSLRKEEKADCSTMLIVKVALLLCRKEINSSLWLVREATS